MDKIIKIIIYAGFSAFSLCGFSACSEKGELSRGTMPVVDADFAYSMVEKCSAIAPRGNGSAGTQRCIDFLSSELHKLSLPVIVDKWRDTTPEDSVEFTNVMTEIPGSSSDFILIGSHYDTKKLFSVPDFAGANDGGSSTGLLLAMIKSIVEHKRKTPLTLKFIFFDGEECFFKYSGTDGLFGSRHLAEKWKSDGTIAKCRAVIILDMIGDKDLNIAIPSGADSYLTETLIKIAKKQNHSEFFSKYDGDIIDDHTPFQREGIPTIDIIDFEFGKGNRYWHTKADTMDKISRDSLKITGDAALELLWNISR
jgi:glutaminyl-peptide cyclotransferase